MIAISVLGISFQWLGLSSHSQELVGTSAEDARVGGTIGTGNGAAAYIAMLLPIAIVVLWMDLPVWIKRLSLAATGAGIVALVLTYSRGGWLAALVAALFVAIIAVRRGDVPGGRVAVVGLWASFFSSHSTGRWKLESRARLAASRTRRTLDFR